MQQPAGDSVLVPQREALTPAVTFLVIQEVATDYLAKRFLLRTGHYSSQLFLPHVYCMCVNVHAPIYA